MDGSPVFILRHDERERRDSDRNALAAQLGEDPSSRRCERCRQIARCYRGLKAGTEAARSHGTQWCDCVQLSIKRYAGAHGCPPLGPEPDATGGRTVLKLLKNDFGRWETPLARSAAAARFLDGPRKASFDRRRALIDVRAIKAESCFQAERIPRAKP